MSGRVTLKTIAEYTGLSVPTVSQILNNRKNNYSSAATREKVLAAAKELHYRPSFGYQLMQGKKTNTVAVLLSSKNYFNTVKQRQLLIALIDGFNRLGCTAYVHTLTDNAEKNCEQLRNLIHRGVESVVIYGHPFGIEEMMAVLQQSGVNFICNNRIFPRYVSNGSDIGRKKILEYIISQVGDDFKFICPGSSINPESPYLRIMRWIFPEMSFDGICSKYILPLGTMENFSGDDLALNNFLARREAMDCGYRIMEKLFAQKKRPRAVMFSNDAYAMGGAGYLLKNSPPETWKDTLIAGYNNDVPLETFPFPVISGEDNISRQAELMLKRAMDQEECQVTVAPRIHIRKFVPGSGFPGWVEEVIQL